MHKRAVRVLELDDPEEENTKTRAHQPIDHQRNDASHQPDNHEEGRPQENGPLPDAPRAVYFSPKMLREVEPRKVS